MVLFCVFELGGFLCVYCVVCFLVLWMLVFVYVFFGSSFGGVVFFFVRFMFVLRTLNVLALSN